MPGTLAPRDFTDLNPSWAWAAGGVISTATDLAGNVGQSTNDAIYAPKGATVTGTAGNDLFVDGGSTTFVFQGTMFGQDVIKTLQAGNGGNHDVIQFDHTAFADYASVLAHAAQVGSNVVIAYDAADTVTLTGIKLNQLTSADFHFV